VLEMRAEMAEMFDLVMFWELYTICCAYADTSERITRRFLSKGLM
jgi:hypothetical protein